MPHPLTHPSGWNGKTLGWWSCKMDTPQTSDSPFKKSSQGKSHQNHLCLVKETYIFGVLSQKCGVFFYRSIVEPSLTNIIIIGSVTHRSLESPWYEAILPRCDFEWYVLRHTEGDSRSRCYFCCLASISGTFQWFVGMGMSEIGTVPIVHNKYVGGYDIISVCHWKKIRAKTPTTKKGANLDEPPRLNGILKRRPAEVSHIKNL